MSLALLSLALGLAQQSQSAPTLKRPEATPPQATEQVPAEEDEQAKPKEYAFNPIQALKEVRTGDYYLKRGKYKAAVARYQEATRWNENLAEAYLKLGEAQEKQDEPQLAREAYQHFLDHEPDSKQAAEVRKRMQKLAGS